MAKAMGINTISSYFFWNVHELDDGTFDFGTENRNISQFIQIVKEEGMYMLVRPGPYVCAEWDFGGFPSYLLFNKTAKIRCSKDNNFIRNNKRYFEAIGPIFERNLLKNGGNILFVQLENEYGSWLAEFQDKGYMLWMEEMWR